MPRKKIFEVPELPFHATARCVNSDWFRLPMPVVWQIFSDYLYFAHHAYGLCIHAFVLMSNHFHLLASAPNGNRSECMWSLMLDVAREITRLSGRTNQTFGGPHKPSLIDNDLYLLNAYRYIYRNPVDAGISNSAEQYPYSTLNGLLGFEKQIIPLTPDLILFPHVEASLTWINTSYKEGERDAITRGLKKSVFSLSVNQSTRKAMEIADDRARLGDDAILLQKRTAYLFGGLAGFEERGDEKE